MSEVVKLENVWKSYSGAAVLRGVSLKVHRGEIVVIRGRSGSGKTTLLSIMALIKKPEAGKVYLMGIDSSRLSEDEAASARLRWVGFIPQFLDLLPTLTVYENVELPLAIARKPRRTRAEAVESTLRLLDLWHLRNRFPSELSGGERQRVAIARAIVNSPALILADEPTAHLDEARASEVYEAISGLARATAAAVVISTTELEGGLLSGAKEYLLRYGLLWSRSPQS
ncbi:MAG: ABC transporter ATP-binding protein [Infirmifilum sp.]